MGAGACTLLCSRSHIEGHSTVFGTALNYTVLRLVGVDADHPMMVRARSKLYQLGGATAIPSWGKLWLAILNVYDWDGLNPIPPELWLLPDFVPIHPWRWWIHTRMVYLPMGFLYGKRFKAEMDPLIASLREELYPQPYDEIYWPDQRNNVAEADLYSPHTRVVDALFQVLGVYEKYHMPWVRNKGIQLAYQLIVKEDENTGHQCLGPVNKMLNYISRWVVEGSDSEAMRLHREKLKDFVWMSGEGLMMTGTNGSQLWDTSFIGQALVDSGLVARPENKALASHILAWLDACQIRENPRHYRSAYRFATKGAWPFSTREQGYTVSDCTAEGLKGVLMLQESNAYVHTLTQWPRAPREQAAPARHGRPLAHDAEPGRRLRELRDDQRAKHHRVAQSGRGLWPDHGRVRVSGVHDVGRDGPAPLSEVRLVPQRGH